MALNLRSLLSASVWVALFLALAAATPVVEDVFVPPDCESIAKPGDHLLLEYSAILSDGTVSHSLKQPKQPYHIILDQSDLPVMASLKGMCSNATRRLYWENAQEVNLLPIFLPHEAFPLFSDDSLAVEIRLLHITNSDDYEIFSAMRQKNVSKVLELIDQHVGVNAYDEWGQTPLMISVQMQRLDVTAALLNTRMPKVDVNAAKSSGFTALFYAVEKSTPSIVSALLRRGADPNAKLLQEGSRDNTPLHIACLLEKTKHAEALLEYGAKPDAVNQFSQTPLQMLPRDAVPSTKLSFKKMFDSAFAKQRENLLGGHSEPSASVRNDL